MKTAKHLQTLLLMTDCYMIDEVLSYGKSGALISNKETLAYGVSPFLL